MVILDTDSLTIVQRAEGVEYQRLAARLDQAALTQPIAVTVISYEEQMRGWLAYIARQRTASRQVEAYARLLALQQDFAQYEMLPFDAAAAQQLEQLKKRLRIGTMDLKIASIALVQKATLVSRNLRDYRQVPGLKVEDWTVS